MSHSVYTVFLGLSVCQKTLGKQYNYKNNSCILFFPAGLSTRVIHGMIYNPLTREWKWIKDTNVNYALHAVKPDLDNSDLSHSHHSQETPS